MTRVDFYFDPGCPWTWLTSRWLVAVAVERDLAITWRPYSLTVKNGDEIPEHYRAARHANHRALRVVVALDQAAGNEAVSAFYTELGYRTFGGEGAEDLPAVLRAAGLDPSVASAADDASRDAAIERSMDAAHALAGDSSGSPILAIVGSERGFFGPVITDLPADAGGLWDAVTTLTAIPELHELKRDRQTGPAAPPRP